jgi:glyoxylate reductase
MPATVYVTRALPEPGIGPLRAAGLRVVHRDVDTPPTRAELLAGVGGADAVLCLLSERIDVEVLDAAPGLRVVANLAVGFDNIDVEAARTRGVVVTTTPGVLTEATADLAWALLMATARRVAEADALVRRGEWRGFSPTLLLGAPVAGATLGVVGLGAIGAAVARRARGFGMTVLATSRTRRPELEAQVGAAWVTLDELLVRSDFVTLHAPLTERTRHLIDADALARMKPSAILINTARGALVDEAALVDALGDGVIAGAGLDVFEREPALAEGLAARPETVLLPHLGSATTPTRAAMVELACANVIAVIEGRPPPTPL